MDRSKQILAPRSQHSILPNKNRSWDDADEELSYSSRPKKHSSSFSSLVDSLFSSNGGDYKSDSDDDDPTPTFDLKGLLSSKDENDNDLRSLRHETTQELSDRPRHGVIYKEVTANIENIRERLDYLSNKEESFTIDEAIEIADAALLLKLFRRPKDKIIDVAQVGKLTHEGALLILQGEKLIQSGRSLLHQGKSMLQLAKF